MAEKDGKNSEKNNEKICVLICAGNLQIEDKDRIEKCLWRGAYLVAVDGGLDYCCQMGLKVDLCLGDFDSVSSETLDDLNLSKIVKLPVEKDDTDTLAALKLCVEKGYKEFYIFGGCGGRLDHTVANIQCLLFLKRKGCKGFLVSKAETIFVLKDEEICFEAGKKGILSLFALSGEVKGVSIFGMKYNLDNAVICNDFPIGISNEFTGQAGKVNVSDGEVLVIMSETP